MTTTAWAHLPNAAHIDRVLASAKADPDQWEEVRATPAWDAPRAAACREAQSTVEDFERVAEYSAARYFARYFARDAVLALIAYDDCAYMLESDPSELAILAKFGDPRAILLLPACKAFHSLNEIV